MSLKNRLSRLFGLYTTKPNRRNTLPPHARPLRCEPLEDRRMLSITMFVDDSSSATTPDGLSWATAYSDLQSALSQAAAFNADGDTANDVNQIWIAEGTYKPTAMLESNDARSVSFSLLDGVALYGGFAGTETTLTARDLSAGHTTTLSGDLGLLGDTSDNAYTVVYCGSSIEASFDGLTITGGNANGVYDSNHPEKISGGGIYNQGGTLTITNSTLSHNLALFCGGGIDNHGGVVTVANSAISHNEVTDGEGGGGICNERNSTLTIVNSTISDNSTTADNSAGSCGGGIENNGTLIVANSTLSDNSSTRYGGGIDNNDTCSLSNTIVANNTASLGPDMYHGNGTITGSYNLIGNGTGQTTFVDGVDGNLVGTSESPIDPMLDADGRPMPGSPVIDAGSNALVPAGVGTDKDGNYRIIYGTVDMGAYEFGSVPRLPGDANGDLIVDGSDATILAGYWQYGVSNGQTATWSMGDFNGDGMVDGSDATILAGYWQVQTHVYPEGALTPIPGTLLVDVDATSGGNGVTWSTAYNDLQTALTQAATLNADSDTTNDITAIWLAEGTYKPTALLESTDVRSASFSLLNNVTLCGGFTGVETTLEERDLTTHVTTLSGDLGVVGNTSDNAYTVVYCGSNITTALDGLTITGGNADGSSVSSHNERRYGGGVYSTGTLTLTNSTIASNAASTYGGGIYSSGTLTLVNSTVTNNTASSGGGLYNYRNVITVTDSTFTGNSATSDGGGIYSSGYTITATMAITGSSFENNSAASGGGLYSYAGKLNLTDTHFTNNSATNGGGIYNQYSNSNLIVTNATFSGNAATSDGGGIYNYYSGTLTVANSFFENNSAASGGGICNESNASVTDSFFEDNSATYGGGIYNASNASITDSFFENNSASSHGGGIYNQSTLKVANTLFTGNVATNNGGAVYNSSSNATITNSTLSDNTATSGGGIWTEYDGISTLNNSILWQNEGGDVEGLGHFAGLRNLIGIDPKFVDPSEGDYRLQATSPAINYGSNALAVDANGNPLTTDLDGNARVYGTAVDCGAFEFQDEMPSGQETPSLLVTTASDVFDLYDGQITLREAIYYADPDTLGTAISFDATLDGSTITLLGTSLVIGGPLTINASSLTSLTIDADDKSRVLTVFGNTGNNVLLQGLTITSGSAANGGGIYNSGTLTIVDSTITGNVATINGGGIINSNNAKLIVADSTITNNQATDGGGVYGRGSGSNLSFTASHITDNTATSGGGIYSFGSTVVVTNTLITDNTATNGGGIYRTYGGNLTVTNATIANNSAMYGGGISGSSSGTFALNNSILWQNEGGDLEGTGRFSGSHNLIGIDPKFVDPSVGDYRLQATSPAINYGSNALTVDANGTPLANDLDGNARIYGTAVDCGALEFQGEITPGRETPSLVVTTASDVFDLYDGQITLREAIYYADPTSPASTITFDATLDGATITLLGSSLLIDQSLTIDASSLTALTIDGNEQSRVLTIIENDDHNSHIELRGLTITGGSAQLGGGIHNSATLTVINSTLVANSASNGGGICSTNGSDLTVINSTISDNVATSNGGGISGEYEGNLTLIGSTLSGNSASTSGGGVWSGGYLSIADSTFLNNSASTSGGGVYTYSQCRNARITDTTFSGNSASYGGGINHCSPAMLTISSSTFSDNSADRGGGIYSSGRVMATNSTFSGNTASTSGGAIYNNYSSEITNSTLLDNLAGNGSGVYSNLSYSLTLNNTIVANHSGRADLVGNFTGSNNLIGNGSGQAWLVNGVNGNQVGTSATPIDPMLGPLQDNGGTTLTHEPLAGSTAIDAGNNTLAVDSTGLPLLTDQRGYLRNYGPMVDIGAVESQPPGVPVAYGDVFAVAQDDSLVFEATDLTGNDFRSDGSPLDVQIVTEPEHGTLVANPDGSFTYTPDAGFWGVDRISYQAVNGSFVSNVAEVILSVVSPQSVIVTTADDEQDGNLAANDISLREALYDLGATQIQFSPDLANQSIVLGGTISITNSVYLVGLGSLLVIDGDGQYLVFDVTGGSSTLSDLAITRGGKSGIKNSATLTIQNSTLFNNTFFVDPSDYSSVSYGGAIDNWGVLVVTNSTISGNSASGGGGIYNSGTLTVTESSISNNSAKDSGGGIYNTGTATVTNSTISGNSAGANNIISIGGGGIFNTGTLTVTNSTLSGNSTNGTGSSSGSGGGGGIYNYTISPNMPAALTVINSTLSGNSAYNGGGIYNRGALTVTNSTLSGNSARGTASNEGGGGIYNYMASSSSVPAVLTVTNSTIVNNSATKGGGIFARSDYSSATSITLNNTIVANNTASSGPDIYRYSTTTITGSNNLIGNGTGQTSLVNGTNGNQVGTSASPIDPMLGPLQNNGGPTLTHAPLTGSPAIDAGSNSLAVDPQNVSLLTDQRGSFVRQYGTVDIGAVEVQPSGLPVAYGEIFELNQDGSFAFDESGLLANDFCNDGSLLTLQILTDPRHGTLVSNGNGSFTYTPDAGFWGIDTISYQVVNGDITSNVVDVMLSVISPQSVIVTTVTDEQDGNLAADDISLREALYDLGASQVQFSLDLLNRSIVLGGTLNIANVTIVGLGSYLTIDGNDQYQIFNVTCGDTTLSYLTITDGYANYNNTGGAIFNSATLTIANTTFFANTAQSYSGAIYNTGTLTITDSTFNKNLCTSNYNGRGAAIYNPGGTVDISGSSFINNSSQGSGGAICSDNGGTLTITNSTFTGNTSMINGGAIYNYDGTLTITNSTISDNSALLYSYTSLSGCGGGIYNDRGIVTIIDSTISGNMAFPQSGSSSYTIGGGGIYNKSGSLTVMNSCLSNNTVRREGYPTYLFSGGGICNDTGTVTVIGSTFSNNSAGGGGVCGGGSITISDSTFSNNNGGGIDSSGTLTVTNSTITNNDGSGVYSSGTLTVTSSTIANNSGSGIYSNGNLTVINSTIANNTSSQNGGGICVAYNTSSGVARRLLIVNSTISGNSASEMGGGIYCDINGHDPASITITNSTILGNTSSYGGGIYYHQFYFTPSTSFTINNSIVANNSATSSPDVVGQIRGSNNLIGVGDSSTMIVDGINGNQVGTAASPLDPMLGPLQDNGGSTMTHAPLAGSPVIDAGNNSLATDLQGFPAVTDQRGYVRQYGALVDIGAVEDQPLGVPVAYEDIFELAQDGSYTFDESNILANDFCNDGSTLVMQIVSEPEHGTLTPNPDGSFTYTPDAGFWGTDTISYQATNGSFASNVAEVIFSVISPQSVIVTTVDDEQDGNLAADDISLREALVNLGASQVQFSLDLIYQSVALRSTLSLSNVHIVGLGETRLTIGGNYTIAVTVGSSTISDVTIFNSVYQSDGGGAGIYNSANLTLVNTTVSGNGGFYYSYGIRNTGTLTVIHSTISGNQGTGIYNESGTVTVTDSTISGNTSGGVHNMNGTVTITNSTIANNSASGNYPTNGNGGGIYNYNGMLTVTNSTIAGNSGSTNGGGIYNYNGMLTVTNSTIAGNSANGNDSTSGNGGGIYSSCDSGKTFTITVTNSTLANNAASGNGGGIFCLCDNSGKFTITITNSTLSGNSASSYGGGVYVAAGYYDTSILTVTNSTFSGNSAGAGGGIYSTGQYSGKSVVNVTNSTFTGNSASTGGGIYSYNGTTTLENTIVANNTATSSRPDLYYDSSSTFTGSYNLIGNGTGQTALVNGIKGNKVGTSSSPIDPKLGPLQDNGGPTLTHEPLPGSPAIDAGNNALALDAQGNPLMSDQRGSFVRQYGTVDIGAVEVQPLGVPIAYGDVFALAQDTNLLLEKSDITDNDFCNDGSLLDIQIVTGPLHGTLATNPDGSFTYTPDAGFWGTDTISYQAVNGSILSNVVDVLFSVISPQSVIVTTADDEQDGNLSPNDISLREALYNLGASQIQFSADLAGQPLILNATLSITNSVHIVGLGTSHLTIDGNNQYQIFNITAGNSTLSDLTVKDGYDYSNNGGAIYNAANLTIANTAIINNSSTRSGGAIYNLGTLTVTDSTLSGNSANEMGGGIYNSGTLTIDNSTLSDNSVYYMDGGGIYNNHGVLVVTNSTFSSNSAKENTGGGIHNFGGTLTLTNTSFLNNFAEFYGAGICNSGEATVTGSIFLGNSTHGSGGGIYNRSGGILTVSESTFSNNSAGSGGGIYHYSDTTTLNNTIVANNTASSSGPDLYRNSGTLTGSYNLIGNGSGQTTLVNGVNGNQVGTTASPIDPMLDADGRPMAGSPAIDAGSNALIPAGVNTDKDGNYRIFNGTVDIGAYEFGSVPVLPGDANRDLVVDGSDATILAGYWQYGVNDGHTATWAMGDFNGDGVVDGSDATILAGYWQVQAQTSPDMGEITAMSDDCTAEDSEVQDEVADLPVESSRAVVFTRPANLSLGVATVPAPASVVRRVRLDAPFEMVPQAPGASGRTLREKAIESVDAVFAEVTWNDTDLAVIAKNLADSTGSKKKPTNVTDKFFESELDLHADLD